jgi:hypothetical protein
MICHFDGDGEIRDGLKVLRLRRASSPNNKHCSHLQFRTTKFNIKFTILSLRTALREIKSVAKQG